MVDHTKQFGESSGLQRHTYFQRNSLFFIVCDEPNATLTFLKNNTLTHYLSCIGHRTDFSLVWGLLRLIPVIRVWHLLNSNFMIVYTKVGIHKTSVLLKTTDGKRMGAVQILYKQ